MSRYIRIDEAKARTTQLFHGYEVEQWLETLPSTDICFCKECRWVSKRLGREVYCEWHGFHWNEDSFCSYGERSE